MADEPIGSVRVDVVADYSKLSQGFQAAQAEAAKAGASIASSLQQAAGPALGLEQATNRIVEAITRESAAGSLAIQRNLALSGARGSAASAANEHAKASAHEVTQLQATSAAIRTLEGNAGLRAVENFIAKTLGAGPAMKAIFPIVGGIAFAELLGHIAESIQETITKAMQARGAINDAWHGLQLSFQTTNDQLQLTSDRLANHIALLQHKPQNTLLEALDQDRVMADRLSESLEGAIEQMKKLLEEQAVGAAGILIGVAPTKDPALAFGAPDEMMVFKRKIASLDDQIRAAVGNKNAMNALIADRYQAFEKEIAKHTDHLEQFMQLQGDRLKKIQAAMKLAGGVFGAAAQIANPDQSGNIATEQGMIRALQMQEQFAKTAQTVGGQTNQLAGLEAGKKAAEEQMRAWEEALNAKKAADEVSVTEERNYWRNILSSLTEGSSNYRAVLAKVGSLNQQVAKQWRQAELHEVTQQEKEFRDQLKEIMGAAEMNTGEPGTAGKQFVQATLARPQLNEGEYKAAIEELPKLTAKAAEENDKALNRLVEAVDEQFAALGKHTAADVVNYEKSVVAFLDFVGASQELIDKQLKKQHGAEMQVSVHAEKSGDIGRSTDLDTAETAIALKKMALESAYALAVVHTFQQQIQHLEEVSALEARGLQLRLAAAQVAHEEAMDDADDVKMAETKKEVNKAQLAIQMQQERSAEALRKIAHDTSFKGMIDADMARIGADISTKLAGGLSQAIVNAKGFGSAMKGVLKEIEAEIINSLIGNTLKQLDNALGKALGGNGGGIGQILGKVIGVVTGGHAGQPAKAGQSADPLQVQAERLNTTAVHGLTAAIQRLIAEMQANTSATTADSTATTADATATASTVAGEVANTAALAANTVATWVNTAALIFDGIMKIITGGGGGGGGGGGEEVTSSIHYASGGRPTPGVPLMLGKNVAELGDEMFVPDSAGTIFSAERTRQMLAAAQQGIGNFQIPQGSLNIPNAPASAFFSGAQAQGISSSSASAVSNHNTGSIGTMHFNITESRNPRQTVREISNYMKLASSKFSPFNK